MLELSRPGEARLCLAGAQRPADSWPLGLAPKPRETMVRGRGMRRIVKDYEKEENRRPPRPAVASSSEHPTPGHPNRRITNRGQERRA